MRLGKAAVASAKMRTERAQARHSAEAIAKEATLRRYDDVQFAKRLPSSG